MSDKLMQALIDLEDTVNNFEQSYEEVLKKASSNKKAAPSLQVVQGQKDLFSISQDKNAQAITEVLDRTINRVEKLVGEGA